MIGRARSPSHNRGLAYAGLSRSASAVHAERSVAGAALAVVLSSVLRYRRWSTSRSSKEICEVLASAHASQASYDGILAERAVVAEAAAAAVPLAHALVHAQLAKLLVVPTEQRRALRGAQIVACQCVVGVAFELRAELRIGAGALDDLGNSLLRHVDPSEFRAATPDGVPHPLEESCRTSATASSATSVAMIAAIVQRIVPTASKVP